MLLLAAPLQSLHAGDTADRQAIENLLAGYGYFYDEGRMDAYFSLFSDNAVLVDAVPGKPEATLGEFRSFLLPRVAYFAENNIQRRHVLAPVHIETMDGSEASGNVYLQLYSIVNQGAPQLLLTGVYHFTVVKEDQGWRIARWRIQPDSSIE